MAQDGVQMVEVQDKPDGCLSTVDEEREPCLKQTAAEKQATANADHKNNGTATAPAAATAAAPADGKTAVANANANNNSNSNSNTKNGKFRALTAATNLERKLRDETGYSRIGLFVVSAVALLCLVLFTILVVLLFEWPRSQRPMHVCRSASCLRASAEVLPKLNINESPCEHFRDYACGGWLKTNDLPSHMSSWNLKKRIQLDQKEKIRNMVVTLQNVASSNSFNWKMKHFYESCMNVDLIENEDDKSLKKIITELGGWSVLKDFTRAEWDRTTTLVSLLSKYNVNPFFKIDVVPDDYVAGQHIIQISPAGLGLPNRSYYYLSPDTEILKAYQQFMIDVTQMLGATSSDAHSFSTEMFSYERRIAEITPTGNNEDPYTSHHRITVAKLKESANMVPLLDILQSKFPEIGINDDTFISVVSKNYFDNLSQLISTTDHSALNNYYIWKLAEAYVPYLSIKFRNTVKTFNVDLTGEKDLPPRWETCVSLLQRFMGFGIATSLEQRIGSKNDTVNEVKTIFDNIKKTIISHVNNNENIASEFRDHVLGKLNTLSVQVGLNSEKSENTNADTFYKTLAVQKLDFFSNVLYAVKFLNEYAQKKLKSKGVDNGWADDLVSVDPKVTYNVAGNKVFVPMSLLSPPYYEIGYPEPLLYGNLGVEIASAVLSSVYPPGVVYGVDGVLLQPHSVAANHSMHATTKARSCFGDQDHLAQLTNNTALAVMLSVSSVRFALQSLSKVADSDPRYYQPAMESYDYDQLFFMTYAQSICSIKSPELQKYSFMYNESLLLKTVTDHSSWFKNAFQCNPTPTVECNYFY